MTPIRKSVTVPLPPDQAFDLFTTGIDGWWPKNRPGRDGRWRRLRRVDLSPKRGGHLMETSIDGEATRLGTVTRWEPGRSLTIRWEEEGSEGEVTVAFTPSDKGTRVDLTHMDLPVIAAILIGPVWQARLSSYANKGALMPVG